MPSPSIEKLVQSLPRFLRCIVKDDSPEDQYYSAFALAKIAAAGTSENTKLLIDHGFVPILVKLLSSPNDDVQEQAVMALGNIAVDSPSCRDLVLSHGALIPLLSHLNEQADLSMLRNAVWALGCFCMGNPLPSFEQVVINHGSLQCLLSLLTHDHNKSIKQAACRTVSNITAGNREQIKAVIEAGLIAPLVNLLQNAEFDIQKEAGWALSNAASGGTHAQIKYLASQGCIKPLCDLLVCPDTRFVPVCLEGLENFLKVGEADKNLGNTGDVNLYAQMMDIDEVLEKIENLQSHDNSEIYEKAVNILKTYWLEDEDEDETLPPGNGSQPGFNYGGNDLRAPPDRFNFSRM